jgi:hypothetical protein
VRKAIFHEPCESLDASIGGSVPLPFLPQTPSYLVLVQPDSTVISKWELLSEAKTMNVVAVAVVEGAAVHVEAAELVAHAVEFVVGGDAVADSAMVPVEIAGIHGIGCFVVVVVVAAAAAAVVAAAVAEERLRVAEIGRIGRPAGVPESLHVGLEAAVVAVAVVVAAEPQV